MSRFFRKLSVSLASILSRNASSTILKKTWWIQAISPRYPAWASRTYLISNLSTQYGTPRASSMTRYSRAKSKLCRELQVRRRRSAAEEALKDTRLCRIKLQADKAHRPSTTTHYTLNQHAKITKCLHLHSTSHPRMYLLHLSKIQSHSLSASSSAVTRVWTRVLLVISNWILTRNKIKKQLSPAVCHRTKS